MIKSKKATIFSALIVFALVFVFAYGSLKMMEKRQNLGLQIGEKQFQLLDVYGRGENALFFVDVAAKESMKESAKVLNNKFGGDCGGNLGRQYYSSGCVIVTDSCFASETKVKNEFIKEFEKRLSEYAAKFPEKKETPITLPLSYEARTTADGKTEVIGMASDTEIISVNLPNIAYSVETSFKQQIDIAVVEEMYKLINVLQQVFNEKVRSQGDVRNLLNNAGFSDAEISDISITSGSGKCSHSLNNEECEVCFEETGTCEKFSEITVVNYDEYDVSITVKSKEKMFVYNPQKEKYELEPLSYSFSVSWVEEEDRETKCP